MFDGSPFCRPLYIYLHSCYRIPLRKVRLKLHQLGLNQGRIFDFHHPDCYNLAVLSHNNYVDEVIAILNSYCVILKKDFNSLNLTICFIEKKNSTLQDKIVDTWAAQTLRLQCNHCLSVHFRPFQHIGRAIACGSFSYHCITFNSFLLLVSLSLLRHLNPFYNHCFLYFTDSFPRLFLQSSISSLFLPS